MSYSRLKPIFIDLTTERNYHLLQWRHCIIAINDRLYENSHLSVYILSLKKREVNSGGKIFYYKNWPIKGEREREMFYLTTHSTHFIYGYMASDIWLRTILIVRKETRCRHIGYSYRLTARVLLYALSHRQDNTYHGLCYTSRGALAGTRNIY